MFSKIYLNVLDIGLQISWFFLWIPDFQQTNWHCSPLVCSVTRQPSHSNHFNWYGRHKMQDLLSNQFILNTCIRTQTIIGFYLFNSCFSWFHVHCNLSNVHSALLSPIKSQTSSSCSSLLLPCIINLQQIRISVVVRLPDTVLDLQYTCHVDLAWWRVNNTSLGW